MHFPAVQKVIRSFFEDSGFVLFAGAFVSDARGSSRPCATAACSDTAGMSGRESERKEERSRAKKQSEAVRWADSTES